MPVADEFRGFFRYKKQGIGDLALNAARFKALLYRAGAGIVPRAGVAAEQEHVLHFAPPLS